MRHVEGVVQDLNLSQYLHLQEVVHRVGRAVSRVVPTERLYVLSLGSQDGNAHVHWHVAPLPPGVPYARQQFHALRPGAVVRTRARQNAATRLVLLPHGTGPDVAPSPVPD